MFILAACGGSDATPVRAVKPAAYVRSVCEALVRWQGEVDVAFDAKSSQSNDSATIRQEFLQLFDKVQHATDALRTRVERAGTPSVSGGEDLSRQLRDTVVVASDKLRANRTSFAAIRVTDVEPAIHIEGAMTEQGDQVDAVSRMVGRIDTSSELRQARERDPACAQFEKHK